jgi:hypothetical protein
MPVFSAISKFYRAYRAWVQRIAAFPLSEGEECVFLFFHSLFHSTVEMLFDFKNAGDHTPISPFTIMGKGSRQLYPGCNERQIAKRPRRARV